MGLADKLAAARAGQGAPYPGGPPGQGPPPPSLQPGGGAQKPSGGSPGQYQAYPGGPPSMQKFYQKFKTPASYQGQSTPSPRVPYASRPSYGTPAPSHGNLSGPSPSLQSHGSPQPPYAPAYSQPQYQQQHHQHQQQSPGGPMYSPQQYQQPPSGGPGYGGMAPQSSPSSYPPQGGPSGHQQQWAQQFGQMPPSPTTPQQINAYKQSLIQAIGEKGLQNFYAPNSPHLDQIAQRAAQQVSRLSLDWRIDRELANDVVRLALYDIILFIDDSGSMAFEENGSRIDDLKLILGRISYASSLFDADGVQVRFLNNSIEGNGIKKEEQVQDLVSRVKFNGLTPIGTQLRDKVLEPLLLRPARDGRLPKPVLVITITDGQPAGEAMDTLANVIRASARQLASTRYGRSAAAFQFAQVGNDLKAREFLSKLDEEPDIGDVIDCTSNYEVEADEMNKKTGETMTPDLWLLKLLLGSIDPSYDSKDEENKAPNQQQHHHQHSSSHGAPPPGQYGGQPPMGGSYGAPPGPPPLQQQGQGGYGGPPPPMQGGYPGGPPPMQGGYGGPPPPHQQGGYGGPPPQGYQPPPGPPPGRRY